MHFSKRSPIAAKNATKNPWPSRAINGVGAMAVVMLISWEIGWPSRAWFQQIREPKPAVVAKAPTRAANRPIEFAPPRPKGNDSSVSPVSLDLLLVHTTPGRTLSESTAQIGVVRDSPQTYQGGAILENGARLAEVRSDYVVLEKGGRSIRLYVDPSKAKSNTTDPALAMVGGFKPDVAPTAVSNREILTDYLRPSPVYEGDWLVGYQVYPGNKAEPFAQMGLQAGDVITAIDGVQLSDPNAAWTAMRQLTEGAILEATVKRKNDIVTMTLDGVFITRAEEAKAQPTSPPIPPPGI